MSITEIKKWTAVMVLVGMIMSIGGSIALTRYGVSVNAASIERESATSAAARALLQLDVDNNSEAIQEIRECQAGIESDISVIRNDQRWLVMAVGAITEVLGVPYPVVTGQ